MILEIDNSVIDTDCVSDNEFYRFLDNKTLRLGTYIKLFLDSKINRIMDIDVSGDIIDDEPVALCLDNEIKYTDKFFHDFNDVLNLNCIPRFVDGWSPWMIVECGNEEMQQRLYRMLYTLAGFVSETVYDQYVIS